MTTTTIESTGGGKVRAHPNSGPAGRTRWFLAAVAILYALGVFWGLPSVLAPASDAIAPLGPLSFIAAYRNPNITYIYPAVHQLLLDCFYAVVLAVCKAMGLLGKLSAAWPYGMSDPSAIFSVLILVSNLVSLLMGVAVLDSLRRIRTSVEGAPLAAMAILGLGGVFTYYARVPNLDMPYLFWLALAFVALWRFLFGGAAPLRLLYISAACSALAIGTKDQSAGVVLGFGLVLLAVTPAGQNLSWRSCLRNAALFSAALLAVYALAAVAPQPQRWWRHVVFVTSDHVMPEFPPAFYGQVQLLARSLVRLSHVLSPVGVALAGCGLWILFRRGRRREALALLLPPLAYYISIIAKVRATEERYLLPIAWYAAILISIAVGAALSRGASSRFPVPHLARLAVTVAILQQFVWGFVPVTWTQMLDLKRSLARDLPALVPPGSPLLVTGMVSFNIPNSHVYQRYRLMRPPGEPLEPPSTHGENLFHPYESAWRFALVGSPHPKFVPRLPPDVELVRQWTFPRWIKAYVHVPSIYEFSLYERK